MPLTASPSQLAFRQLARPLHALALIATRIGRALNAPAETPPEVEVGTLPWTLQRMRQTLLDQHAQQRIDQLTALLATAEAFTSTLDVSEVTDKLLLESRRVCPSAIAGFVALIEPDLGSLVPAASFGCRKEILHNLRFRPGEGALGEALQTQEPQALLGEAMERDDLGAVVGNARRRLTAADLVLGRAQSALCLPIVANQRSIGSLVLYDFLDPTGFPEPEQKVLQGLVSQAAAAIDNAQLYTRVQQHEELRGRLLAKVLTAQEEERRRIARDLHDGLAQSLTALMMAVEAVEKNMATHSGAEHERLLRAKALADRSLGDVRRLIWDLRPTVLDDLGLASAVRWYAEQRLEACDTRLYVSSTGFSERLPSQLETDMYRVLQEAIANVARHAEATQVSITLGYAKGWLTATVEDDGCGFDMETIRQPTSDKGLGLLGMRERVERMSGSLAIQSAPGQGTCLAIKVPVPNKE